MPLTAELTARVRASHTKALDLSTAEYPLSRLATLVYANGTGANQADLIFQDQRTISPSSNDDLDLAGVLVDGFGVTLTFAKVKALFVAAASGNINNVVVGGQGAAAFITPFGANTDKVNVRPGGVLLLATTDITGYAVTPTTADILRIANSGAGTSVTYDIVIIGASA